MQVDVSTDFTPKMIDQLHGSNRIRIQIIALAQRLNFPSKSYLLCMRAMTSIRIKNIPREAVPDCFHGFWEIAA